MMPPTIQIAPSLLSSDLSRLEADVRACERGGADVLHVDVMDGHFVPPITFGPLIVETLKRITSLPLDCHLMVENPDEQLEQFAAAGASWISVHAEVCKHLHRTLARIQELGCKSGIVLNPSTPLDYAMEGAVNADFILLMSVNPGYGGQAFIPSFFERCKRLRSWLDENDYAHVFIQVDGGIKLDNARAAVEAGASVLVSGSGIMKGDIEANIRAMRVAAMA